MRPGGSACVRQEAWPGVVYPVPVIGVIGSLSKASNPIPEVLTIQAVGWVAETLAVPGVSGVGGAGQAGARPRRVTAHRRMVAWPRRGWLEGH